MATARNWLSGFAGLSLSCIAVTRRVRVALGADRRALKIKRSHQTRPVGDSRYGAWLTETVAYHH